MVMVNLSYSWRQRLAILQYQRGLLFIQRMAYASAIAAFGRALRWHPHPAEVYVMRGTAYCYSGNEAAALADYAEAIALEPDNRRAHSKRGLLRYAQGDEAGALADWNIALAGNPIAGQGEASFNRAMLYLRRQDEGAALRDLDRTLAINPNHAEAYFQRGNLRDRLGDRAGAIQDWELAISNDFGQDAAKLQLQSVQLNQQQQRISSHITQQLQALLQSDQLLVQIKIQSPQITVQLHRPTGLPINYRSTAEAIRSALVERPLETIHRFRMELYVQGSNFIEWSQSGEIYAGEPCPKRHWPLVSATTLLVFPVGLPAALFAWRTQQLFERGDYVRAQQTSKTAQGLCQLGLGLAGCAAIAVAGYGLYQVVRPKASKQQTQTHGIATCSEREARARCITYHRPHAPLEPRSE